MKCTSLDYSGSHCTSISAVISIDFCEETVHLGHSCAVQWHSVHITALTSHSHIR